MIVGSDLVRGVLAAAVGVQIFRQVVLLGLHVGTHLVERRGRNHVALAIDLPGDGGVARADLVATGGSGRGSGVLGNLHAHAGVRVDNHATEEVGVVKLLIVNDGEDLGLDADLHVRVEGIEADDTIVTEDTVVERSLVLIDGATGAGGGVRPVDLIGLADLHVNAVFPVERGVEFRVFFVEVVALGAKTDLAGEAADGVDVVGAATVLVELSLGAVLGTEVPMDVHGAEACLEIGCGNGDTISGVKVSFVAKGDIASGLLEGLGKPVDHAVDVTKVVVADAVLVYTGVLRLLALATVGAIAGSVGDGSARLSPIVITGGSYRSHRRGSSAIFLRCEDNG